MYRTFVVSLVLACSLGWASGEEPAVQPPPGPVQVRVGIYVKSLRILSKDEQALVDFYYWLRFPKPDSTERIEELKSIEFVNGDIEQLEIVEERDIEGDHYVTGRVKGTFSFVADYTHYPFDRQRVLIQMEHKVLDSSDVVLVEDVASYERSGTPKGRRGLPEKLRTGDVKVSSAGFEADVRRYDSDFGDSANGPYSEYSRLTWRAEVAREWGAYVPKFFLPLAIILGLAYLVFFIPADELEIACSMTVTAILAAIAFQITLNNDLPAVGYLTCVDKVFYLSYLLISLAMVQTIWTYNLDKAGRARISARMETFGRWTFPLVFFGVSAYLMWEAFSAA